MQIVDNVEKFNLDLEDVLTKENAGNWFLGTNNNHFLLVRVSDSSRMLICLESSAKVDPHTNLTFRKINVSKMVLS